MIKIISTVTAIALFMSTSAFAGVSITMASTLTATTTGKSLYGAKTGTASPTTPLIGKTSTGVGIGVLCETAGGGYSIVAQHMNGTKAFGSSFDATNIFSKDVTTKGSALLTVPTKTDSSDFNGWSSM